MSILFKRSKKYLVNINIIPLSVLDLRYRLIVNFIVHDRGALEDAKRNETPVADMFQQKAFTLHEQKKYTEFKLVMKT